MDDAHRTHSTDSTNIDPGTMTGLLKIGIAQKQRPVDRLLDRLVAVDGGEWFEAAVSEEPFRTVFADPAAVCTGPVEQLELRQLKSKGKRMCGPDRGPEDRLRGTLAYMTSVAAGLVHHDAYLSSQPPETIAPVLTDLSGAVSGAWSDLFANAGKAASNLEGATG